MEQKTPARKAPWVGSQVGISDEVLAPWTPIQVETAGKAMSVRPWGRSYEFDEMPFPSRIQTADRSILSAPIRLIARADGRPITWGPAALKLLERTPGRVRLSYTASEPSLTLGAEIDIEYDGVVRIDWTLQPQRAVRLERLTVEIPLYEEHARYLYDFPGRWGSKPYHSGALPADGFVGGFWPFIWLGDEERGLSWFCESDEKWFSADPYLVTEISRSYDSESRASQVILRLHLVSSLVNLAPASGSGSDGAVQHKLSYTFGLQATPVKPVTKDVWDYRIVHCGVSPSGFGAQTRLIIPDVTLDQLAGAGVRTLAVHEHWTDIESYVSTTHGEELKKLVGACHARGMQVLLYFGFLISDLAPEWAEFGDECVVMPRGGYEPYNEPPQPRQNAYNVCYNSVWQDFLAAGIAQAMDEYDLDGVYLDSTVHAWPCANRRHQCGYVRSDGSVAPTYAFWAVRSMMKRIYAIVKTRKPGGQVNVHNSTCMTIPTLAWATSYWAGEQFRDLPPSTSAAAILALDVFRTEFMGHQWGVPAEFLSYEEQNKTGFIYRDAYAFTLLHDVLTRSFSIGPALELNSALWRLSDEFGRKEAQWLPYWSNSEYVTIQPDGAYVSLYQHPKNGVLAVVSNLGRSEETAAVQLSPDKLGLCKNVSARDALTAEAVPINEGLFKLTLKSLEWKVIWAS